MKFTLTREEGRRAFVEGLIITALALLAAIVTDSFMAYLVVGLIGGAVSGALFGLRREKLRRTRRERKVK